MKFPRSLTSEERELVKWMLQHGETAADEYLSQLEEALVSGICGCGCASIDFQIGDQRPDKTKGMTILSDFLYGSESPPFGAFVFSRDGVLAGLEVYGFGETADRLPRPNELRLLIKTNSEQDRGVNALPRVAHD